MGLKAPFLPLHSKSAFEACEMRLDIDSHDLAWVRISSTDHGISNLNLLPAQPSSALLATSAIWREVGSRPVSWLLSPTARSLHGGSFLWWFHVLQSPSPYLVSDPSSIATDKRKTDRRAGWFAIPDLPEHCSARFLSPEERELAVTRLGRTKAKEWDLSIFRRVLLSWQFWLLPTVFMRTPPLNMAILLVVANERGQSILSASKRYRTM